MLGIEIQPGRLDPCDACAAAKAKQKNIPKVSTQVPSKENAGRVFLDTATVKKPKGGPRVQKPNWRVVVDERTKIKTLDFFETKDGMVEPTCELFQK